MTGDDGGVDVKPDDPVPPEELPPNERVAYMRGQREKEREVRDLLNDLEEQKFQNPCDESEEDFNKGMEYVIRQMRRRLDEVDGQ